MNKVLCMYSGGIDSTGMLYEIFNKNLYSEYDLHIHHVSLITARNRHIPEKNSVTTILDWFSRNYPQRKFKYTENIFEFNFRSNYGTEAVPDDTDVLYFIMAQIIRSDLIHRSEHEIYEKILIGETKTDIENFIKRHPKYADPNLYHYRANKIYDTCFHARFFEPNPEPQYIIKPIIERPIIHLNKKQIMKMLPKEVLNMTWSCRIPNVINNKYYECRKCSVCMTKYAFDVEDLKQKLLNNQPERVNGNLHGTYN